MAKILIIGSGGREHALAVKFSQSKHVNAVFVAPGNPGMMLNNPNLECPIKCVNIEADDNEELLKFASENQIDLTFVGPETSLANGVVDIFRGAGMNIIGPSKSAARLESSKGFAKKIMVDAKVPTANYQAFEYNDFANAEAFLKSLKGPYVIKEDGLAAGKGVYICQELHEATETLNQVMNELKSNVVIEEFLQGPELSYFSLINHDHIIPLAIAQDYKRAYDFHQGPNTGGMGAISPVPNYHEAILFDEINDLVVRPLIHEMIKQGVPYTGILYTGLMMTEAGPKVIEFNARFGDPETQVVLPRITTDLYEICQAHLERENIEIDLNSDYVLGVVLAGQGYPGSYEKGMIIHLDQVASLENFRFSGVSLTDEAQVIASGGRILMLINQGKDVDAMRDNIIKELDRLNVDKTFYRKDIGSGFE